jgi:hypothetical protein
MGSALVGCTLFSIGLIPIAVSSRHGVLIASCVLLQSVPLMILSAPAFVSNECDKMLEQLNDISFLGDLDHKDRCDHLRKSFSSSNKGQGLGFLMFDVVIDKRMLRKIILAVFSASGTIVMSLYALGVGEDAE